MKLSILVPHYKEDFEVLKPLLDSIAIQQNIDFSTLEVIIAHNPGCNYLDIPTYPFAIIQTMASESGVSAARNQAFSMACGDYVMFCDADDMFYSVCGLQFLYREFDKESFDNLISSFIEEIKLSDGSFKYVTHKKDAIFIHGKVYRRQYLIDNKIYWNNNLIVHEDSYFNLLSQNLATNIKYCSMPFYLWKWKDDSVSRHDSKYILKTYINMIDSNDALVDEFIKRGLNDRAVLLITSFIFSTYYMMNKPEWIDKENKEYRDKTEKRFSIYYKKRKKMWNILSPQDKMGIGNKVREQAVMEGMIIEVITIDAWLKHIEEMEGY